MPQFRNGSLHLGRVLKVNIFVHWSWFVVAYFFIVQGFFGLPAAWGALAYVGLFGIVLLHEYGHALACRSVGGRASTIVMWPLGGIAFVDPPPRPGAVLWSVAAGPLVNVVLFPVLLGLVLAVGMDLEHPTQATNFQQLIFSMFMINTGLLVFNLMPIYPLDGGQILQALLWFFIGRAKSLRVVSIIGLIAAGAGIVGFLWIGDFWLVLIALFIGWQAWRGKMAADYLAKQEQVVQPWERGWKM